MTRLSSNDLIDWLHGLDSYTNAEYGQSRTLVAIRDACIGCGCVTPDPDRAGFCAKCAAKRRPDNSEVILFRPLRRRPAPAD